MTRDPESRRRGRAQQLHIAAGIAAALASFVAALILAYFLSDYLYGVTGYHPQELVRQLITFAGGMVIMATVGSIFARSSVPKQIAFWQSVIAAIRQMATGDFNVNIEIPSPFGRDDRFVELVQSINHMAGELGQLEKMRQEFGMDFVRLLLLSPVVCLAAGAMGTILVAFVHEQRTAQAATMLVMMPQLFLSGALIPMSHSTGILAFLARIMPMTYIVDLARAVFYWGQPGYHHIVMYSPVLDAGVTVVLFVVFSVIGTVMFTRAEQNR